MRLPRLAATVLAMGLALPVLAQAQAPSGRSGASPPATMQKGTTPPGQPSAPTSSTAQGKLVDINHASASELDALPGVGKARADAIIKNRPYKGKDDLVARHVLPQNVYNGIKDKIIARQS
ncbi:MAG: helix-hairpin-helix domain-containing protein [Acetobacteraceae bacterium]|nr:helix-hairpin-helix domain-containing protein [Acetobacteraceae bacterium]